MDMKKLAGDKAATYVKDGMVVGLGTGSTAYHMVNAVGEMVKNGLKIQAIPTSKATEAQARELGIPLLTIDELDHVDLAIDGVDEIDPQFNAIKGGGGALYREKVVASMAKEVIWIMDESKLVDKIGAFHLPVEIAQYGSKLTVGIRFSASAMARLSSPTTAISSLTCTSAQALTFRTSTPS